LFLERPRVLVFCHYFRSRLSVIKTIAPLQTWSRRKVASGWILKNRALLAITAPINKSLRLCSPPSLPVQDSTTCRRFLFRCDFYSACCFLTKVPLPHPSTFSNPEVFLLPLYNFYFPVVFLPFLSASRGLRSNKISRLGIHICARQPLGGAFGVPFHADFP